MNNTPEPTVCLEIPASEAEAISDGMADLLCWCRGYMAGCEDLDKHPMGVNETRELRIKLQAALRRSGGRP